MGKLPISLIIDDAGPVNTFHFHHAGGNHPMVVPPVFALQFGRLCRRFGVKGKFSVVPIPGGLGRLDRGDEVAGVPPEYIETFVNYAKDYICPNFSITSEILTHHLAWDPATGRCLHVCEDEFVSRASAEQIADYVGLSLEILNNLGLDPAGVTSPWLTGIDNEENYARGIGMAFKKTLGKELCFYFCHSRDELKHPVVMCDSPETGRVVSIPNNCHDPFWETQMPVPFGQARKNAAKMIDALLSPDGKTGELRVLFEAGEPLIFITHWQSLFSDGRGIGIEGLEYLLERIGKVFGSQVEWLTFAELAARA